MRKKENEVPPFLRDPSKLKDRKDSHFDRLMRSKYAEGYAACYDDLTHELQGVHPIFLAIIAPAMAAIGAKIVQLKNKI